jgi:large subunit ribosomal protein L22
MTGPKTNEGATTVGERVGTRARVRYVRVSAYKAREVLDLIRGLDVRAADEVLQFTERDVAIIVRKALASAVANAQHNEGQDPDELKVVACFADEGPTLKRFRPRARGRAGRIRKRTCHITVIVARMSEAELELRRRKEAAQPAARRGRTASRAAQSRRERVARSRQAAAARSGHDHDHDHDHDHEDDHDDEVVTDEVAIDEVEADEVTTDENDVVTDEVVAEEPADDDEATNESKDEA